MSGQALPRQFPIALGSTLLTELPLVILPAIHHSTASGARSWCMTRGLSVSDAVVLSSTWAAVFRSPSQRSATSEAAVSPFVMALPLLVAPECSKTLDPLFSQDPGFTRHSGPPSDADPNDGASGTAWPGTLEARRQPLSGIDRRLEQFAPVAEGQPPRTGSGYASSIRSATDVAL